jgi:hypothetical protein
MAQRRVFFQDRERIQAMVVDRPKGLSKATHGKCMLNPATGFVTDSSVAVIAARCGPPFGCR